MTTPQLMPPASGAEPDLRRLARVLARHRRTILLVTGLAVVVGVVVTLLQRPIYRSEAVLLIENEEPGTNLLGAFAPPGFSAVTGIGGGGGLQTDVGILMSRQVAEGVVDSLGLQVVVAKPSLPRDSLLAVTRTVRNATGGRYELRLQPDGSYRVRVLAGEPNSASPASVAPGGMLSLSGIQLRIRPDLPRPQPEVIELEVRTFRAAVAELRRNYSAGRPDPGAQLVRITFDSPDPGLAAAVPNQAARSFANFKEAVSRAESLSTVDFLQDQVETYRQSLLEAEGALERFREQAAIYSPEEQARQGVTRAADLQAEYDALVAEKEALGRLLSAAQSAPAEERSARFRQLAAFPPFFANGAVQDILRALIELDTERSRLLRLRQPENFDVRVLSSRITELENQLLHLAQSYDTGLTNSIATHQANLARFGDQLSTIPRRQIELARLAREQQLQEEIFTLLQTRLKEEQIDATKTSEGVRIVDSALVPGAPVSPKPVINVGIALILGLVSALAIVFAREISSPRVHTATDALAATVGVPIVGVIPHLSLSRSGPGGRRRLPFALPRLRPVRPEPVALVTRTDPNGQGAEAFRLLRTNLTSASGEAAGGVMMVASAVAGEGKTTSAANLAVSLARQGLRTVLVDADLRRGSIHQLFHLSQTPGVAEILSNRVTASEAIQQVPLGDGDEMLHVLVSGRPPMNPAELLDRSATGELLGTLRQSYDVVVLDTPPLHLFADAAIIGREADGALLVVRVGVTDMASLGAAAARLGQVGAELKGVVLNDVETTWKEYSYYSGHPAISEQVRSA